MSAVPAVRALSAERLELGEGARWVDGRLVLVDILAGHLYEHRGRSPGPLLRLLELDVPLGAVAPVADGTARWIAAAGTGVALISADGDVEWLGRPEDAADGRTRMNDGVADPAGRFWAGSMAYDGESPLGKLYRVDRDGSVRMVLDGLIIANGPAFSPDGNVMFLADTPRRTITSFDVSGEGELTRRGRLVVEGPGSPDGMTVDADGQLWVAMWGAGEVLRLDPDGGRVTARIPLPASQPTSVCLVEGRLLVTTAATWLDPATDGDGRVYEVELAELGLAANAPAASAYRLER